MIGLIVIVLLIIFIFVWKQLTSSQNNTKEPVNHSSSPIKHNKQKIKESLPERVRKEEQVEAQSQYTSDVFQAGMNVLVYGHPNISEADQMYQTLRELGINSIAITFPFFQENWRANEVKVHPTDTPTLTELQTLIEKAHEQGLSVMLRPILDEESMVESDLWRGQIEPNDPDAWFESYLSLLLTYAELAQSTNVKILNIGTELNSLERRYDKRWITLIEEIRHIYDGELIYSFNWDVIKHIPHLEFVHHLDHVGIDAYFPLEAPDGASVQTLEKEWEKWMNQIKGWFVHDSIIVTEVGTFPVAGSYRTPYSWVYPNGRLDLDAQAHYYEATFETWLPVSQGIYWWCVTLEEEEGVTYSPLHSPTERVIKTYFSD